MDYKVIDRVGDCRFVHGLQHSKKTSISEGIHLPTGVKVRMKTVRGQNMADYERGQELSREATVLARLSHPNIIHVYHLVKSVRRIEAPLKTKDGNVNGVGYVFFDVRKVWGLLALPKQRVKQTVEVTKRIVVRPRRGAKDASSSKTSRGKKSVYFSGEDVPDRRSPPHADLRILVTEWIDGLPLENFIRLFFHRCLPESITRLYCRQMVSAIIAMQRKHILLREIPIKSLMITRDFRCIKLTVIDFSENPTEEVLEHRFTCITRVTK
ncbi:hypothetical protein TSMEX_008227 [Taenia solium]|eukprot:TsM_000873700 transcript=TsM_000873700 gene=TsM_000873700